MMRTLLVSALTVAALAACGGSTETPKAEIETVREFAGEEVSEVAPGVYKRGDGMLVGPCATVKPYVEKNGKPDGFLCY